MTIGMHKRTLGLAAGIAATMLAGTASAQAPPATPPLVSPAPAMAPAPAPATAPAPAAAYVQTPIEAVLQDASEYARATGVTLDEATRRLLAQQGSVAATDGVAQVFRDRLAGIAIEHAPIYRIVVLLTGDAPVADQHIVAGGIDVPIVFRTGARATREAVVAAIGRHQAEIRATLRVPPGIGLDQRTGEMVITARRADVDTFGERGLAARFGDLTGVPVRLMVLDGPATNSAAEGGSRVVGVNPLDGKRYACTTGFVVTDGVRRGVVTAAHCPDSLTYYGPDNVGEPLDYVGQWGWGYQDVQVNVSNAALRPLFYADSARTFARSVSTWRARASTRAGDVVCHRGERTGYSCAQVELTDFAPAGDLCGGACLPTWITVGGPGCKGGDSGGPVFSGAVAFGILKGSSYRADGSCGFYYYMSVDFLPEGWSLLRE